MAKVSLRVRHEGGQGVVRGLDPLDSVEKLVSHSLEVLGVEQADLDRIKMLSGELPSLYPSPWVELNKGMFWNDLELVLG